MAKRRPAGDGMVRKREDGRWEGRIVIGHKENGEPLFRHVYAKTQKALLDKLHQNIECYRDVELTEDSRMTLGEWLDRWLAEYKDGTIRPGTLEGYRNYIENYIKPQLGGKQVKDASGLSLKHLLIGSEGTLAVITKCLLRLVPKPEASLSVLVPYADLKTGIQSVLTILRANANPTAVEFMERKVVALGERFCGVSYPRPDAGSYILLTFDGRSEEVTANAARVRSLALQNGALDFIELSDARQCADIWRVRGALVKAVEAVSEQEPVDIVVPISRTADFIRFINDLEAQSGMQMVSFGHAGDGNVHLCVVRGERDEETWQRELHENMDRAYAEAYRLGGVASGEHGIGLSKRPYFLRQTAKENLQAMNAIKTALDPQHILNNGKSYLTGGNNNAGTF